MCELLKHGAQPSSQFIQLSSVIRICALGLLKGHQSFASAAAMMVSAYLCVLNFNKYRSILFCKLPKHVGTGCKMMNVFNSRVWQMRPKRCAIG